MNPRYFVAYARVQPRYFPGFTQPALVCALLMIIGWWLRLVPQVELTHPS